MSVAQWHVKLQTNLIEFHSLTRNIPLVLLVQEMGGLQLRLGLI